MHRVEEIRRLHHVVLLVAAQTVLRAEGGAEMDIRQRRQDIHRVGQVARHRGWMGQQGDTTTLERGAQSRVFKQAVNAELHG